MSIVIDKDYCTGCGKCVEKCSHHALKLENGKVIVNNALCANCGICIDYCPNECLDLGDNVVADDIVNKEEKIKSSVTSVTITPDNPCIMRLDGCNNCRACVKMCLERERKEKDPDCLICLGCGQCIHACPQKILKPKNDIDRVINKIKEGKICVAYTAPATRVALGDSFNLEPGTNIEGKLIAALRKMGFKYVLDVNFGADVTIIEEASELIERIKNNKTLPMITSCCPAWISYAEHFYPELLPNISSCKSPIGMEGALIDNYFIPHMNLKKEDVFTVAITPCTAKKGEIQRPEIVGTDAVLTIQELTEYIKKNMDFYSLENDIFDDFMGTGSGGGAIFANTGGVMESALRTANYMLTGNELDTAICNPLHGMAETKELSLKIGNYDINVLAVNGISNAIPILEDIKNGNSKYQFIEIMNCKGGCIGGGGLPILSEEDEMYFKNKRISNIYNKDQQSMCRAAHNNPEIKKLYNTYLKEPLSDKSLEILHTTYTNRLQ